MRMRVNQVDGAEVPFGIAQRQLLERAKARRDLETPPSDTHGAVTSTLMTSDRSAERMPERIAVGRRASDIASSHQALNRRAPPFPMQLVVVFPLDPRQRCIIETLERELL